ncbi:MAG: GNAT family N-acetyltransferase [Oscillospiraceae bacterium]
MTITLEKADIRDLPALYALQVASFAPLYEVYHDDDTSPAAEPVENLEKRMMQPESIHYQILADGAAVGALRIKKLPAGRYHLAQISVLPSYQGQGIAQKALTLMEQTVPDAAVWELETILQEKRNCHLYEKMGYRQTGAQRVISEAMTLTTYEKRLHQENRPQAPLRQIST